MSLLSEQWPSGLVGLGRFLLGPFIALAGALLWGSLLLFGDLIHVGVDLRTYTQWAIQFSNEFGHGNWYPRWMPLADGGLGQPVFMHYSPLFFVAVSIVDGAVGDVWLAMKLVVLGVGFVGGYVSWRIFRGAGLTPGTAGIGVLAIQGFPFLMFLLYSHHALPWYATWPAALAVLWLSVQQAHEGDKGFRAGWLLAIAVAVLTMTHILAAFMVLLVSLATVFVLSFDNSTELEGKPLSVWFRWIASVSLGLGLAAVYLVPALFEQHLVSPEGWFKEGDIDWRNSFALSTWTASQYGFRWFFVQWPLAALIVMATLVGVAALVWNRHNRDSTWYSLFGLSVASAIAIVLASEASWFLWAHVPEIARVQWPYRFLFVAGLACALIIVLVGFSALGRQKLVGSAAKLVIVAWLGTSAAIGGQRMAEGVRFDAAATMEGFFGQAEYHTKTRGEHWRSYVEAGALQEECLAQDWICLEMDAPHSGRMWAVKGPESATFRLPVFQYPAWVVRVNGRTASAGLDSETGLILVDLNAGDHVVELYWERRWSEKLGAAISAFSFVLLLLTIFAGLRSRWQAA